MDTNDLISSHQCAELLGVSLSYLYKLTSSRRIPYYRPNGKRIYFLRSEIFQWITRNKVEVSND